MILQEMAKAVEKQMESKADGSAVTALEATIASRLRGVENALLKGLKAVSEKAAAALATKLAIEVRHCIPQP